jgi:integrase/recombinase XerD
MARHTFATTICLGNGVRVESLAKMLGHAKITTTMIYAHVMDDKLLEDTRGIEEEYG